MNLELETFGTLRNAFYRSVSKVSFKAKYNDSGAIILQSDDRIFSIVSQVDVSRWVCR